MSQLSTRLSVDDMKTKWASTLNPILNNPLTNPNILKNISLAIGNTTINHGLQQTQQGWWIIDQDAASSIYRSAAFNDTTLTLHSSAACTVSIAVF